MKVTDNAKPSGVSVLLLAVIAVYLFHSATAYSIEEKHPFILYTAGDVPAITERLSRSPFDSWFSIVLNEADMILEKNVAWDQTAVPKVTQGYYAKMLAFAYVFADPSSENREVYGDEAAKSLYNLPGSDYKKYFPDDLSISEAAYYWSAAYDMLKGAGFDFAVEGYSNMESSMRSKFKNLRDYMARDWDENLFPPKPSIQKDFPSVAFDGDYITIEHTDNHHVKLYASLTILSLSIYNESGSSDDFSRGRSRFRAVLNNMTITGDNGEPAGGWAEGPRYHAYCINQYIPAFTALRNTNILDMNTIPELIQTHLWLPRIVMPDGYVPPIDDNESIIFDWAGLLYSMHAGVPERDMLHWMWITGGEKVNKVFLPDYIAQFDDTPPVFTDPNELGWTPTGFYPESGFARFRSSWDNDAVYMLFLTEHGEARENGQAHEHPDPNSFILHAYGDMLLLDSGYGGWTEHDDTRFAQNHNLILVDGEGPEGASQVLGSFGYWNANGADAYLTEYFASNTVDYAMSTTAYSGTDFSRSIVFPDHRYFLVYDRVSSDTDRTFTLLLHGNGGGTSGGTFAEMDNGAIWERDNALMRSYTVGSSDLSFDNENMMHAVYSRTPMLSHTVLKASQSGSDERFVSLLYPERKEVPVPDITIAEITNGKGLRIARNDTVDYAGMHLDDSAQHIVTGSDTYISDGEFVYVSVQPEASVRHFFFIGGTYMESNEGKLVLTSNPVNLTADYRFSPDVEGYIQAEQETQVVLYFYNIEPLRVTYHGDEIPFDSGDHTVSFTVSGKGAWKVEGIEPVIEIEPPGNIAVSDVDSDHGHSIRITWTPSPSEDEGFVEWYRVYRSRSDTFTDVIPITDFDSVDALIEWEKQHTVFVDSVAAGLTEYEDRFVPLNNVNYYYWLQATGSNGESEKVAANAPTRVDELPAQFTVKQPYPNPFNASTVLEYYLPIGCSITLEIYDTLGRKVQILEKGMRSAGYHRSVWNGKNDNGLPVSSGLYFYRLSTPDSIRHGKILLLR